MKKGLIIEKTKSQRNNALDLIKFVASFFVVCIHIPFLGGDVAVAVNAAARFAVPTFFAISGFYAFGADAATLKRRLLKVIRLYLISSAVYHAYGIVIRIAEQGGAGFFDYISDVFLSVGNVRSFFIFNIPFSSLHLWYLLALIYVYLIWLLILKLSLNDKIVLLIGVSVLLANLVLGELLSAFGIVLNEAFVRNFALLGLPFFIFGYFLGKYNRLFAKIKPFYLIIAIVIGSSEAVLSRFLIGHNEVYVGSVLCCFSIVILAEKIKHIKPLDKQTHVFRSSIDVYVLHLLFSKPLYLLARSLPTTIGTVIVAIMPCIVFAACIAFYLLKSVIIKYCLNLCR